MPTRSCTPTPSTFATWPGHSVYEVGHRVTDRFDDVTPADIGRRTPRVFITGDACHTHSAKAGQGMNVSMQDGFNIGWKLGHVLDGRSPESLLSTYSSERQVIAQNLIDFDKQWSHMMAKRPEDFDSPSELEDFYVKTAEFPAGFMTQYQPSMIVAEPAHQLLAEGFPIGKRFKSAPVIRVADANPVHLGHHHRADGRWRIYAFAGPAGGAGVASLDEWADWLANSPDSPVVACTPKGVDVDAIFDVKVIYQQGPHRRRPGHRAPDVPAPGGSRCTWSITRRCMRRSRARTSSRPATSTVAESSSSYGPTSTSPTCCP